MPTARSRFGIEAVDGKIYAIGGLGVEGVLATNEEYDPASNTWDTKEPIPSPRCDFAIAVYDDKIYTFGGRINPTEYAFIPEAYLGVTEVYNSTTDTWETKTSMPTNRCGLSANVVNGKIYLIRFCYQSPQRHNWKRGWVSAPLRSMNQFVDHILRFRLRVKQMENVIISYQMSYVCTSYLLW